MALPLFVAGLAVGGLAVAAFNNRAKIADEFQKGVKKAKKIARKELDEALEFTQKIKRELKPQKPKRTQSTKRKRAPKEDKKDAS
ncbi:MAG: hypothetical protein LBQ18_07195 [Campylobacteraceae bacterium]|jgi:predicted solute-binding protein|nr:hypothetical protein [Campylobacteraceae bacterium]